MDTKSDYERGYDDGYEAGYAAAQMDAVEQSVNDDDHIVNEDEVAELGYPAGTKGQLLRTVDGTVVGFRPR